MQTRVENLLYSQRQVEVAMELGTLDRSSVYLNSYGVNCRCLAGLTHGSSSGAI